MTESTRTWETASSQGNGTAGAASKLLERIDLLVEFCGRGTAWLTVALVILVACNVILRYLFSIGAVALQELEWHLVSPIALIGMSYGLRRGEHVRVDLFYERFPPPFRTAVDLVTALLMVVVSLIIVKLSLGYVGQSFALWEGSPDPGGLPFRFLLKAFIPLGFFVLFLQGMLMAIASAVKLFHIRP